MGCNESEKTLPPGGAAPWGCWARSGGGGVYLGAELGSLITPSIMAALNKRTGDEMRFHLHCCRFDPPRLFEGDTVGGQEHTGGGRQGPEGPEVANGGPPRGTTKDREKDGEGGRGSTSQLNLTISLPGESNPLSLLSTFHSELNQLAGQTICDQEPGGGGPTFKRTVRVGKCSKGDTMTSVLKH